MNREIQVYNDSQSEEDKQICHLLYEQINQHLPDAESKIWHAHPVWFLAGNPIVGYSKLKQGVRLMFWSGADFDEDRLKSGSGKFKDASCLYIQVSEVNQIDLKQWLDKARNIQWDYKNLVKRKGELRRIQ